MITVKKRYILSIQPLLLTICIVLIFAFSASARSREDHELKHSVSHKDLYGIKNRFGFPLDHTSYFFDI